MGKNNDDRKIKINDDAKSFAKASLKKFKKNNKGCFDSKSEMKEAFYQGLLEKLPGAIEFCVKYGHIQEESVQEAKIEIYKKINDPKFIKLLKKEVKKDNDIENIKLFPIIAKEILCEAKKVNDELLAQDQNAQTYDVSDVTELSQLILNKKIEKLVKKGVNKDLAFDLLSIIPNKKSIEYSQFYRVRSVYDCLYDWAKEKEVPFAEIIDVLVDDEYYAAFITFALLERKEKFTKLTESQKALYLKISNWAFEMMDKKLSNKELDAVLKTYVNARKKDEAQGKDGNRRYALASLSETEYERIAKSVKNIISADSTIAKYFN